MFALTTRSIESAKPSENGKDRYLRDGDGLELRIRPNGKKIWQLRYTRAGRRKVIRLGDYTLCSLKEARSLAQDIRKKLSTGQDPSERLSGTRKPPSSETEPLPATLDTSSIDGSHRLSDLLCVYAEWKMKAGKIAYAKDVTRSTRLYVEKGAPEIAKKPASECTAKDMAVIIRPLHERGKLRSARNLRILLSAAFQAAMQAPYHPAIPKNLDGFNVTHNPVQAIPSMQVKPREKVLSQTELGLYGANLLTGRGLACWCLTLSLFCGGQRPLQVARVTDSDYDESEGILTLHDPKGRRQIPRTHSLPLGTFANKLIISLFENHQDKIQHPVWFSLDGVNPLSSYSLSHQCSKILARINLHEFQLRDIRRTVETEMARIGFSKDIRAHLLSHGLSGIQERHYDRYDRLQEKREALEKWEAHLLALIAPFQNKEVT